LAAQELGPGEKWKNGEGKREKEMLAGKPHDSEKCPFDTFMTGTSYTRFEMSLPSKSKHTPPPPVSCQLQDDMWKGPNFK